ncbi:MAG TPA: S8 family serine peptidase [bacterium]|jgi:subtilisin family serine protease
MKRYLIAVMLSVLCSGSALLWAGTDYTGAEYLSGRLIVGFSDQLGHSLNPIDGNGQVVSVGIPAVDELLARYHVTEMRRMVPNETLDKLDFPPDFYRTMILLCPDNTDILKMMADFEQNPYVETVQPDLLSHTYDRTPNDSFWGSQWDKRLMHCPAVWEFSTGSRDIICIAVDGGNWWKHNDLHDNLWVNPGEDITNDSVAYSDTTYPGDQNDIDGEDNDHDGKIDDLLGWDFVQGPINNPPCAPGEDCDNTQDNDPVSLSDHGTHVAGIMGAVGNNNNGVAGVNWNVKVIAARAGYLPSNGQGGLIVSSSAVNCMLWAVTKGARIINMSYGSTYNNPAEQQAITSCWNQGAILCGAAGNDGDNQDSIRLHYPGADANVVCVGSVDDGDNISYFSCRGTWVDLYSPGNGVTSTVIPGYAAYPGTSMASPNAAGVFALLWSLFPEMSNAELVDFVFQHCQDIGAQNEGENPAYFGMGRIDAMLPLAAVRPNVTVTNNQLTGDTDHDGRLEGGETASLTVTVRNDPAWAVGQNVQVVVSTDDPALQLSNASFTISSLAPGATADNAGSPVQITAGAIPNAYWSTLTATITADGGFIAHRTFTIRVGRPQVLVVADDDDDLYQNYFMTALTTPDYYYNYDAWNVRTDGDPTLANIAEYGVIIWVCGNENTSTLTADNQTMLSQWLDSGSKRLLLAGQGIDQDISGTNFYSNYLHAQTASALGGRNLVGISGDPISEGTTLLLIGGGCGGNGNIHPSRITPVNGGEAIYNYGTAANPDGIGAVRFANDTYKVAYFAFAIEAACGATNTTHYSTVLHHVMEWFGATATGAEPRQTSTLPAGFALHANYPNPFNPTTTLAFDLPRTSKVTLTIFDMLGRQVAVLANGPMPAGSHNVSFDGSDLASGTYLAHLQADGFSATQKMLLLK